MTSLRRITDTLRSALSKRAGLLRVLALVGSALLMSAGTPNAAEACGITDPVSCVALIFIKIFQLLTALMGWILVLEVDALIRVSQYHNFVSPGPSAVRVGWIVTRDLANMFFIVILLIIAFGTILGSSTYHYEKNLPRLLIMAIVINFSKTICGIFIDMGQVIMLTFVNGFKEAAGGNFVNAFQINKLLALGDSTGSYTFGMVVAMMFAFILSAIAVSVVLVMLVSMIFRVVMLWVLIILSPIAFLSSAIPKGGDYYGEWWKEFKAQIIRGPVIAFFLWLALASVQDASSQGGLAGEGQGFPKGSTASAGEASAASNIGDSKIPSEAGATSDVIMNMVIAICLMFAGLKFGTQVGGVGMGTANSVRNAATKAARGVATYGAKRAAAPFMTGVGKQLAKVPLVGGLGRRMAETGEKYKEEGRKASEARWAGSAQTMAKYNPTKAGSKGEVSGATDGKILEMADVVASNPKVRDAQLKSGADAITRKRLEQIAEKDPSKRGALDAYNKATWSGIGADAKTPADRLAAAEKQKAILGKMSGEEARKYVPQDKMSETVMQALNKGAVTDYLTSGTNDQKKMAMGALGDMNANGDLDSFLKDKRMTYADIPAEAYDHAALSGSGLKKSALASAEKDPALMKKFTEDTKMRGVMLATAKDNFTAASTDIEKAQKMKTLSMLGGATSSDFGTPPAGSPPGTPTDLERAVGQLSVKDLNEMERNTPTDSPEAQASLERVITAALKNGSTELAQAIMRSPALSQRVPLSDAREAEKSTAGFTSMLSGAGNAVVADLDRQRKAATNGSPAAAALDTQLAALRTAMDQVKSAAKDLAAAEEHVVTLREDFGQAQKSGNSAAMAAIATTLKTAINDANTRKTRVSVANERVKTLT